MSPASDKNANPCSPEQNSEAQKRWRRLNGSELVAKVVTGVKFADGEERADQFRLLLSSCAYVLIEMLRRLGLVGTELARAQVHTIRLKLLKIGAVIVRNTRRIRIWFSSSFPLQELFRDCLACFYG
jgi:hypothetical protein